MDSKCVITIDIKNSRQIELVTREKIHAKIFEVMDTIKKICPAEVFAIGMTAGDEFQVVLNRAELSIDIYKLVKTEFPVSCYFGVGFGSISHLGKELPSEMYGDCFYLSRNAIENAKIKNSEIIFKVGDDLLDLELNTLFELMNIVRRKQTKRQKKIVGFLTSQKYDFQKELAQHFAVSEQAISKMIRNSGFETVNRTEQLAKTLLDRRLKK